MPESYSVKAILSAQDKNFSSIFKQASSATQALGDQLKSGLGFGVLMEVGSRAVGVVMDSLTDLIGEMGDASAAWKTFEKTMEMNGHAEDEIQSVKAELQDFAQKTIYSASDMASTFAQLDAVGIQSVDRLVKGFGGLAAAAESPQQAMKTLSQQATQMAAKPKVAWEDFKLMLEQTPAGIAAVAKYMGKSTQQLIADVQDGTVATEEFFDAIATVGTNDAFTQLATEYKTVGQAMDGLTETVSNKLLPAFDAVSQIGMDAISAVTDKISSLDGTALAAVITVDNLKSVLGAVATLLAGGMAAGGLGALVSTASQYGLSLADGLNVAKGAAEKLSGAISDTWQRLSDTGPIKKIQGQFTKATGAIGENVTTLGGKLQTAWNNLVPADSLFGKITGKVGQLTSGISTGIQKATGVGVTALSKMSSALISVMGVAMQAVAPAAIFGLLLVGLGFVNSQFGDQIGQLLQTATEQGPQIITNLVQGVQSKLPALIQSGAQLLTGFLNAVTANLPAIFSGGVSLIQTLVQGVAQNADTILPAAIGLVGTLVEGILTALPQLLLTGLDLLKSLSQGIVDNAGLIVDTATNTVEHFVNGVVNNLPAILDTGIAVLENLAQGAIQTLPQLLVVGITAIGTLLSGIAQRVPQIMQAGVQMVKTLVAGIVENLPQILQAALSAVSSFLQSVLDALPSIVSGGVQIIAALVSGLVQMLPSILEAGWNLILTLGSAIVEAIPKIITGAVEGIKTIFSDLWSFITGETEEGAAQVSSTTQAMADSTTSSVLSMSSSASDSVAGMNSSVTGSIFDMNSDVASAADKMTNSVTDSIAGMNSLGSADMSGLADSIISSAGTASSETVSEMESMEQSVSASMERISTDTKSAMSQIPTLTKSAVSQMNNALRTGGAQAKAIAKSTATSIVSNLNSAKSGAYSAGRNIGAGLVNGMNSKLSAVRSAAKKLANAAERAIRLEAQIHSPSRVSDRLGSYWGEGYANGIERMARQVWKASEQLVAVPKLAAAGAPLSYSGSLSEEYDYTRDAKYTIIVPVQYDGREMARVTAQYTEAELNRLQTRANRKIGIR